MDELIDAVRERYATKARQIAAQASVGCGPGCCATESGGSACCDDDCCAAYSSAELGALGLSAEAGRSGESR